MKASDIALFLLLVFVPFGVPVPYSFVTEWRNRLLDIDRQLSHPARHGRLAIVTKKGGI